MDGWVNERIDAKMTEWTIGMDYRGNEGMEVYVTVRI